MITRRQLLAAAAAAPLAGVVRRAGSPSNIQEFTVHHAGHDVRCLAYTAGSVGTGPTLAVVLCNGAAADATQWIDIGLVDAADDLDLTGPMRQFVAIAPDITDHQTAPSLVLDTLVPFIDDRYAPDALGISGISAGAGAAWVAGYQPMTDTFTSVGLHSPAIADPTVYEPAPWRCWIDCGRDDRLAESAAALGADLEAVGSDLTEHFWAGGHDRHYWRRHLAAYLRFHLDSANQATP